VVGVTGMDEELFVLLVPGVYLVPQLLKTPGYGSTLC
jgi:hypothetical protein